eukprot:TRINITY_DN6233_c0_g1_i1.p1 TRINITY_DN6233_c0_g1~~TRINITY_DN6233_c0_g1_i1.p1  ORF type:complete len:194 (-),score=25.97 TRINITY_DN6233_c0_g1_i1:87-668(-)
MSVLKKKKVLINGDGATGKTCCLMAVCLKKFPIEYIPTLFDNYVYNYSSFELEFWDSASGEHYDRLIPIYYPFTEVFLTTFSVISRDSFNNVRQSWIPDTRYRAPNKPIILVGTKIDLREDEDTLKRLKNRNESAVQFEEGWDLYKELQLDGYVEISSLHQKGIESLVDEICFVLEGGSVRGKKKKKGDCILS